MPDDFTPLPTIVTSDIGGRTVQTVTGHEPRLADLERFLAFATLWTWRGNVSDLERVHAVKFHPLVKATKALPGTAEWLDEADGTAPSANKTVPASDGFSQVETEGQKSVSAADDFRGAQSEASSPVPAEDRERVARAIFSAIVGHTDDFHPAFEHDQEIWFEAADEALAALAPATVTLLKTAGAGKTTDLLRPVDVDRAKYLAARLSRDLQTAVNDDRSVPGTEEPRRFAARCATMLDVRDFLRGLVGSSTGRIEAERAEC